MKLSWKIFRLYAMTAQPIVDRLIFDNQNLVIEELMKHDDTLWDELGQFRSDKRNQRNMTGDSEKVSVSFCLTAIQSR